MTGDICPWCGKHGGTERRYGVDGNEHLFHKACLEMTNEWFKEDNKIR
jgi:hypothetical protein